MSAASGTTTPRPTSPSSGIWHKTSSARLPANSPSAFGARRPPGMTTSSSTRSLRHRSPDSPAFAFSGLANRVVYVIRSVDRQNSESRPMATTNSEAGAKQPATTVTLKGIIEQLAEGHDLPKKQANALLAGMIDTMTTHLKG